MSFAVDGKNVRAVFKRQRREVTFEGTIDGKDGKRIAGVYGPDGAISAAYLAPTELQTLKTKDVTHSLGIKEMDRAIALANKAPGLRDKARKKKDPEAKAALLDQAAEAAKLAAVEIPKLHRAVLAKHPGTYAAGRAALKLLQHAKVEANDAELRLWLDLAFKSAGEFGRTLQTETAVQAAMALLARKDAALALDAARRAEALLDDRASPSAGRGPGAVGAR